MKRQRGSLLILVCVVVAISGGYASTISQPAIPRAPTFYGPAGLHTPLTDKYWFGGTGDWSDPLKWKGGMPDIDSNVFITAAGDSNITLDMSASIASLTLGIWGEGSSTLQAYTPQTLTIAGALAISQTGTLYLSGGSGLEVFGDAGSQGRFTLDTSPFGGTGTAIIHGNFSNGFFGNLQLNSGAQLSVQGTLSNSGDIRIDHSGLLVNGDLRNNTGSDPYGEISTNASDSGGSTITIAGTLFNGRDGSFLLNGSTSGGDRATIGNVDNGGGIQLQRGSSLTVPGRIDNRGYIGLSDSSLVAGRFVNEGYTTEYLYLGHSEATFGSLLNNNRIDLTRSTLQVNGDVDNNWVIATGSYGGNTVTIGGRLTNRGWSFALNGVDNPDVANIGSVMNSGNVYIASNATLNVGVGAHPVATALGGYTQTDGQTTVDGVLNMAGRGTINFAGGSVYGNQGTIRGSVISNAAINLGDTPLTVGQLTFAGSYNQGPLGSLTIDIAGLEEYDQLNITGHAQLNGLLDIDLLGSYVPQIGDTFDIMSFLSSSGSFSTVLGLPINGQEHFVLDYNSNGLSLDVVAGQLAGASGEPFITSSEGGSGSILMASSYGAPSQTPEPSSFLLLGSGLLCLGYSIRRRMSK